MDGVQASARQCARVMHDGKHLYMFVSSPAAQRMPLLFAAAWRLCDVEHPAHQNHPCTCHRPRQMNKRRTAGDRLEFGLSYATSIAQFGAESGMNGLGMWLAPTCANVFRLLHALVHVNFETRDLTPNFTKRRERPRVAKPESCSSRWHQPRAAQHSDLHGRARESRQGRCEKHLVSHIFANTTPFGASAGDSESSLQAEHDYATSATRR